MAQQTDNAKELRKKVLRQFREHLGEPRGGDPADLDRSDLMAKFLRQAPKDDGGDTDEVESFTKDDFLELRQRRREQKQSRLDSVPDTTTMEEAPPVAVQDDESFLASMNVDELIKELPKVRDNFASWLGGVDAAYTPTSTPLEELEQHRKEIAYRLKLLKVMLKATEKELDELVIHIRAKNAADGR